jgi:phospholipase C
VLQPVARAHHVRSLRVPCARVTIADAARAPPCSSTLASEFALFNTWHSAVPGPTMVNRAFIDSATSDGIALNEALDIALGYPQRTIFQDLDEAGASWRNYFELVPASWQFTYTRTRLGNYHFFNSSFAADAAAGNLANYSTYVVRHGRLCFSS